MCDTSEARCREITLISSVCDTREAYYRKISLLDLVCVGDVGCVGVWVAWGWKWNLWKWGALCGIVGSLIKLKINKSRANIWTVH